MVELSISNRIRSTPFGACVTEAGVKGYTVYNHMLLPTVFRSLEEDYHHLKSAVQIWDVSCERQVELKGPDAAYLAQLMTPRDLSRQKIGHGVYTPICDNKGKVLNDPVTLKLDHDRFWISVADSDVILFAKGLAIGKGLNVEIFEPDVHPLAVQGPKSFDLMAKVFGPSVHDIPFFGTKWIEFGGRGHLVARSGYSGQGGFEIYLNGGDLGPSLWSALMQAGAEFDVHAGCPNLIERIESGLLSYGNDMDSSHTLGETGLGRFCKTIAADCVATEALLTAGLPERQIRYLTLDGEPMPGLSDPVSISADERFAGQITSAVWSPDYETNVAIGMIESDYWDGAAELATADGRRVAILDRPIAR